MNEEPNSRSQLRQKGTKWPLITVLFSLLFLVVGLLAGYLLWGKPYAESQATINDLSNTVMTLHPADRALTATAMVGGVAERPELVASTPTPSGGRQVTRYDIPHDNDPVLGNPNAKITIIEFSDYECVFCKKWANEIWPQIVKEFGTDVKLVYRDFPLSAIHPNASPAAIAANCAGEQDSYFKMHNLLFSDQQPLNDAGYKDYADMLGLDRTKFDTCLKDPAIEKEVLDDYAYAAELGIQSTPTFFVNGIALVGAQPFEVFQEIITLELEGKLSGGYVPVP
ncbi:MAG TPA: DsbA family protein [Bellilinea sp.]|nr:DsbA family protein [Bellilinea sp.]